MIIKKANQMITADRQELRDRFGRCNYMFSAKSLGFN